jgi:putative hydrolase of the HAD superfamily
MTETKHIFFDLDHTLWDYETNSIATIQELLLTYAPQIGATIPFETFYPIYLEHNEELWRQYRLNEIDNLTLRYQRWLLTFHGLGIVEGEWMKDISEDFIDICPRKPGLMENALALLDALAPRYPLHIITNGFGFIQKAKLSHSGLDRYFDVIVNPEQVGVKKPHPLIFQTALEAAGCAASEALFIGDSYPEDVLGAHGVGMEVLYYNPTGKANPGNFKEISDLIEVLGHLEG